MAKIPTAVCVVAIALIDGEGRVLLQKRRAGGRHGGLWEFPGGKCESGESDLEAARRELAEELGVHVVRVESALFEVADPDSAFVIVFVPTVIEGEPQCLEHSAICWSTIDDLRGLSLAPSDRQFVNFVAAQR